MDRKKVLDNFYNKVDEVSKHSNIKMLSFSVDELLNLRLAICDLENELIQQNSDNNDDETIMDGGSF